MNKLCTIIIVNWNTQDYLDKCLSSIYALYSTGEVSIIVIDNASSDGSVEMVRTKYPQVVLVSNEENVGFAKACNQGIQKAETDYVLLLNSDCEVTSPDLLRNVVAVFEQDQTVGIAGPLILYPNGKIQSAGERYLTLGRVFREQILFSAAPVFAKHVAREEGKLGAKPFRVDWVSGSCLFAHKKVFAKVGLLREDFYMYAEDMEFCHRANKAGYASVIVPSASVVHHKSMSTNKNLSRVLRYSIRNNCHFIKFNQGIIAALLALFFYSIGILLRFFLAYFRKGASPFAWFGLLVAMPGITRKVVKSKW